MNLEKDVSPTGLYNYLPKMSDPRKTRRGSRIGPLKKGLLKKVGYSVVSSKTRRHAAVKRAVKKYGKASTIRKLNAVAVFTRRRSPAKSRAFRADMKFAQKMKVGGNQEYKTLEDVKLAVETYQGRGRKGEDDPVPAHLVSAAQAKGLQVQEGVKIGDFMNAFKQAFGRGVR